MTATLHSINPATTLDAARESIHAKRPVDSSGWLERLAFRAWELRGSSLDFFDPEVMGLTILGSGEMFHMIRRSEKLGSVSLRAAAKRARREAPESFRKPMTLKTEGLDIHRITGALGIEHVAVIKATGTTELGNEFDGITQGIDLVAGHRHPWRGIGTPVIKLASVGTGEHLGRDFLDELSADVPAEIHAEPGFVRKVNLDEIDKPSIV